MEADISTQAVGLASSADFSILKLFVRADFIVKSVIIILIASSIYSWAVIFEKIKMLEKYIKQQKNLKANFGNQNLRNLFIIIYQLILMTQWQMYLKNQWM